LQKLHPCLVVRRLGPRAGKDRVLFRTAAAQWQVFHAVHFVEFGGVNVPVEDREYAYYGISGNFRRISWYAYQVVSGPHRERVQSHRLAAGRLPLPAFVSRICSLRKGVGLPLDFVYLPVVAGKPDAFATSKP
jgi:hypothetical protein